MLYLNLAAKIIYFYEIYKLFLYYAMIFCKIELADTPF